MNEEMPYDGWARGGPAARHSSKTAEWYTPQDVLDLARDLLGGIDLDPASSRLGNLRVRAREFFTEADNGFLLPWRGRVWLNPPGGSCDGQGRRVVKASQGGSPCTETGACGRKPGHAHDGPIRSASKSWWQKLEAEHRAGRVTEAVFLAYSIELLQTAQVDTPAGARLPTDFPICYPSTRLSFCDEQGRPQRGNTHASAIVYLGPVDRARASGFLASFSPLGAVVVPKRVL